MKKKYKTVPCPDCNDTQFTKDGQLCKCKDTLQLAEVEPTETGLDLLINDLGWEKIKIENEKHTAYAGSARKGENEYLFCSEQCAKDYEDAHTSEGLWGFGYEPFAGDVAKEWGDDYPCYYCGKIVSFVVVINTQQAEIDQLKHDWKKDVAYQQAKIEQYGGDVNKKRNEINRLDRELMKSVNQGLADEMKALKLTAEIERLEAEAKQRFENSVLTEAEQQARIDELEKLGIKFVNEIAALTVENKTFAVQVEQLREVAQDTLECMEDGRKFAEAMSPQKIASYDERTQNVRTILAETAPEKGD